MKEEKPLENFNFYRNVKRGKTVEEIIEEYNLENSVKLISIDDVKFGPRFREDWDTESYRNGKTENSKKKVYFRYHSSYKRYLGQTDFSRDIEIPQGMYVYEEESRPRNLGEVLEKIRTDSYYDRMSIRTSHSNAYTNFCVSSKQIISILRQTCEVQGWKFEGMKDESDANFGYLKTKNFTYLIKEVPYGGIAFYDEEGKEISLGDGNGGHKAVLMTIRQPISKELARQGHDFYEEWGQLDDQEYA